MPQTTNVTQTTQTLGLVPRLVAKKYVKPLIFIAIFAAIGVSFLLITNATPASGAIKNPASGKCVDNTSNLQVNHNVVAIRGCDPAAASQKWRFVGDGTIRAEGDYCLTAMGNAGGQTDISLHECAGNDPTQKWKVQHDGFIKNPRSNQCLAIANEATSDGARLWATNCRDIPAQKWDII